MSSRPRVSLISHTYLERSYRRKLDHLALNVDLTLSSPDQFPFAYGLYRADFSASLPYRVHVYPCRFPTGVRTSTRWMLATRDLGFKSFRPHIIHIENEAHSFSLLQALAYRRWYAPHAKVVVFVWANQLLTGVKGIGLNALARMMRPGIDHYIAGNSDAKALLIASGIAENKVSVFPLIGIDVDYFSPPSADERLRLRAGMGVTPAEFVIGFVGRFVEDKGIPDLLRAFNRLRETSNNSHVRLLFAGDGPMKPEILAACPNAIIASPGGDGRILPYYRAIDVLVLPSRTMPYWKEQFGSVLVEAMACGVPVVGSSSGAIPEVVAQAGLVFHERDATELATRLHELAGAPEWQRLLGAAGRERVVANFSHARIAQQMYQVYQRLLSKQIPS